METNFTVAQLRIHTNKNAEQQNYLRTLLHPSYLVLLRFFREILTEVSLKLRLLY